MRFKVQHLIAAIFAGLVGVQSTAVPIAEALLRAHAVHHVERSHDVPLQTSHHHDAGHDHEDVTEALEEFGESIAPLALVPDFFQWVDATESCPHRPPGSIHFPPESPPPRTEA